MARNFLTNLKFLFIISLLWALLFSLDFFDNTLTARDVVYNYYETSNSLSRISLSTIKMDIANMFCTEPDLKLLSRKPDNILNCEDMAKHIDSLGRPVDQALTLIGAGYFREAYLFNDTTYGGQPIVFRVAKVDNHRNRLRHKREAIMLSVAKVQASPYVVHLVGRCKSTIISEYISHRLEDEVSGQGLTELRKARIMRDVAAGVEVLHSVSVAHTDIQVDQFLVRSNGTVALNDLNRARVIKLDNGGKKCGFRIELSKGKWRSPEEHLGQPLSHKIDIFSMGFVFWTVLTGHLPFARLSAAQAKQALLAGGRPPLSHCNSPLTSVLCRVIRSCWASDPVNRPEASVVRRQIEAATSNYI